MKNFWFLSLIFLYLASCTHREEFSSDMQTHGPLRATSRPYQIKGVWYYPQPHYELDETGISSCYGGPDGCHGLPTASGERFDMFGLTAAHKTVPLPCVAVITNLENGKRLKVKINDRGPFKNNRVLDVSVRAAQLLGFYKKGTAMVRVQTLPEESLVLAENVKAFERKGLRINQYTTKPPLFVPEYQGPGIQVASTPSIQSLIESVSPPAPLDPALETRRKISPPGGRHPHLYIQAGRYASAGEASRQRATFKEFGKTSVRKEEANAVLPFKIEIGPLKNVAEADRVLDQLLTSGHTQARIIIE